MYVCACVREIVLLLLIWPVFCLRPLRWKGLLFFVSKCWYRSAILSDMKDGLLPDYSGCVDSDQYKIVPFSQVVIIGRVFSFLGMADCESKRGCWSCQFTARGESQQVVSPTKDLNVEAVIPFVFFFTFQRSIPGGLGNDSNPVSTGIYRKILFLRLNKKECLKNTFFTTPFNQRRKYES